MHGVTPIRATAKKCSDRQRCNREEQLSDDEEGTDHPRKTFFLGAQVYFGDPIQCKDDRMLFDGEAQRL